METANDLLQFQDYTSASQSSSTINSNQPAQISVNTLSGGNGGDSGSNSDCGTTSSNSRQRGDPLANLIYDANNPTGNMTTILIENDNSSKVPFNNNSNNNNNSFESENNKRLPLLTLEYYQQFFNVDTYIVVERIINSIIPKRAKDNYLRSDIEINPDLYGPFWITVTLIFSIAISGNIANYLQYAKDDYEWRYNFHLVSYAATCIFIYVNLMPVVLWLLFKYNLKTISQDMETENADYTPSLLTLICIYGYSISIYIPVSILWVIQISILQWLLVITAALLSGSVLIFVITPALRNSKNSILLVMGILAAHFLLAAGFMLYFFHVPSHNDSSQHHSVGVSSTASSLINLNEKTTGIPHAIKPLALSSSSSPFVVVKNLITSESTSH